MAAVQQQSPELEQLLPPSRPESPQPQRVRQRGRSRSVQSDASFSDVNRPSRRRRGGGRQQQSSMLPINNLPLLPVKEDPMRVVSDSAGNVLGGLTGAAGAAGGKKSDTLKLRLDINLDVDISIKAKVHGDITLSLLQ